MKMNENNRLFLAALAAATAGFGLGMMLAPEKGSDLRAGLMHSLDKLGERANTILDEGRLQMQDFRRGKSQSGNDSQTGNLPQQQVVS